MAKLTEDTIKKLTQLSRIECSPEEMAALLHDLDSIIGYMTLLNELDTSDVPPCNYVIQRDNNVLRKDEVGPTLDRATFLKNAPSHTGGMIRVPPVLKSNT